MFVSSKIWWFTKECCEACSNQEKPWPAATSDDWCCWPLTNLSPILCYRPRYWITDSRWYWCGGQYSTPASNNYLHQQTGPSLQAVSNTTTAIYSTRSLTLNLRLRQTFCWIFIIANVRKPILGAYFLRRYELIMDVARKKLSDAMTQLTVLWAVCSYQGRYIIGILPCYMTFLSLL